MATRKKKKRSDPSVRLNGRKVSQTRGPGASHGLSRYVLPLVIIIILLGGIGFFAFFGYQTATASGFFGLKSVDVRGAERTSADDIRRIVSASAEKPGVWNADLADIRVRIEKFPFVKSAAVSRILPSGIRVNVIERVPAAVVHVTSGNFLVDSEGVMLAAASPNDRQFPFVLHGWDESKTEKAVPDNLARLKVYRKMLDEWTQFDLASRVKQVNISNPREPEAVIEDSGRAISVSLARDSLGKSLKTAIEAISGKGAKIKSVNAEGVYPVIDYLDF
jgi:cell division septal protein FtsQ